MLKPPRMTRRTVLNWLGSLLPASSLLGWFGWAPPPISFVRPIQLDEKEVATLRHIGASALPSSLGEFGVSQVVTGFLRWLREYSSSAEMPHQPGRLDAPLTPEIKVEVYAVQLRELVAAGRDAESFPLLLQEMLADAGIEDLPSRPDGRHIVSDFMSFYFNGSEANDLCYRADIGRKTCRGLPGAGNEPPPLFGKD